MGTETVDNRPDLPELESAETSVRGSFGLRIFGSAIPPLFIGCLAWFIAHHLKVVKPQMIATLATASLVSACLLAALLTEDFHWRTDEEGITARGLLRKRVLKWSSVVSAECAGSASRRRFYRLSDGTCRLAIPVSGPYMPVGIERLAASICQHLRRLRKADLLVLPESAESFWDAIPDCFPHQLEWDEPKPRPWWIRPVLGPAAVVLFLLYFILPTTSDPRVRALLPMVAIMVAAMPFVLWPEWRELRTSASQVKLNKYGLYALTPSGPVQLPWADVTNAWWMPYISNTSRLSIVLQGTERERLVVPFYPKDDNNCRLVLALIRALRQSPHPQALEIPAELRAKLAEIQH